MGTAASGLGPICIGADLGREGALGGAAIAELAVTIVSPGPEGAVGLDGEGEISIGGIGGLPVGISADLHGGGALGGGAITELAIAIAAPGPKGAILLDAEGMTDTSGNTRPSG